jgi:dipeptidyl aminopeptidase/acylaminoacyl peptidase
VKLSIKKVFFCLALVISILSSQVHSSSLVTNSNAFDEKSCFRKQYESYDTWLDQVTKETKQYTKSQYRIKNRLRNFQRFFKREDFERFQSSLSCSTFTYAVNSVPVQGYVMKPKADGPYPVLIFNRGGNGNFGHVDFTTLMSRLFPLTEKGFIIIGSQYRGTFQQNPVYRDEFGGRDVDDVVALAELIPSIYDADTDRIGMFGSSRGGMQTFLALRQLKNIKAVAAVSGDSDLIQGLEYRPEMERVYYSRIPNYEDNKQRELEKRSVLRWADQLNKSIPILLIHGDNDKRVSVNHSLRLDAKLTALDHPHKLVIYPGEGHNLYKYKSQSIQELSRWFKQHL